MSRLTFPSTSLRLYPFLLPHLSPHFLQRTSHGVLYIDGHVCAYHGQCAIASKAYVARRHLAMPATTDYWINGCSADPLFVITGEVDAALTKALPWLLRELRDLVGERRAAIVFDRGGWSPKLFDTMSKAGFDLLTYRKGRCGGINERRFIRRQAAHAA